MRVFPVAGLLHNGHSGLVLNQSAIHLNQTKTYFQQNTCPQTTAVESFLCPRHRVHLVEVLELDDKVGTGLALESL